MAYELTKKLKKRIFHPAHKWDRLVANEEMGLYYSNVSSLGIIKIPLKIHSN